MHTTDHTTHNGLKIRATPSLLISYNNVRVFTLRKPHTTVHSLGVHAFLRYAQGIV